jgi:hypothetical protein
MELTPQQQDQVRQAKASGEKRVTIKFTPEQKRDWSGAVEQEAAGKDANIAHIRKIQAAAAKPGFFGDVRRAITVSRRPIEDLANEIGVDARLLSDFRSGDAELPAIALDRLIETLSLRLMQEIPR